MIRLAAALCLAFPIHAIADGLSPAQARLIELLTYVQVARDRCGYLIDVDLLRRVARREGITFSTAPEQQARDRGFAAAEPAFAGMRRSVECAYALQRFGLEGADYKGLIERRKSPD